MHANPSTPEVTRALKPCPFCGSEAEWFHGPPLDWKHVECSACYCRTESHPDENHAIAAWNTRTPARGGDELREALELVRRSYGWNYMGDETKRIVLAALASTDMASADACEPISSRPEDGAAPPVEGLTSGEGVSAESWMALTMLAPWLRHNGWHVSADAVDAALTALAASPKAPATASVREAVEAHARWLDEISTNTDMAEIVADGGITAGMVVQQEAREQRRRLLRALTDSGTADTHAGSGEVDVERLKRIRTSMALLQQNSEGCAANHYGGDAQVFGMPAWLTDTRADLDDFTTLIAALHPVDSRAQGGEK